ncbi:MAG: phosphoribosylanthranilate isomerase [Planctomycetota bacterium]
MQRTRIKICGLKDSASIDAAVFAGVDAVGLVFVAASPRAVDPERAAGLVSRLPAMVEPVGLFVDEPVEAVAGLIERVGLRTVQLHGREGPGYVRRLKAGRPGLKVIKALSFEADEVGPTLEVWRGEHQLVDALLWDAPPSGGLTGGTGHTLDWAALAALRDTGRLEGLPPMILAGGLTPENVGDAVFRLRPYAVDVSSGVESERGVKDSEKIAAFCAAVRAADSAEAGAG